MDYTGKRSWPCPGCDGRYTVQTESSEKNSRVCMACGGEVPKPERRLHRRTKHGHHPRI